MMRTATRAPQVSNSDFILPDGRKPGLYKDGTFSLRREGLFTITVIGPNRCGLVRNNASINCIYRLELTCKGDSLDNKGFLVEQKGIQDFFDSIKKTNLSCENLCYACTRKIYEKVRKENPKADIKFISLHISPHPHQAGVTYEWGSK